MRDGHHLIGWGVAAGTYPVRRTAGEAMVRILADGSVEVASSGIDMGQGTYTILAQTAAEALGVPVEHVVGEARRFAHCPRAPVAGGSQLANLMTGAVHKAATRGARRADRAWRSTIRNRRSAICRRTRSPLRMARSRRRAAADRHSHRRAACASSAATRSRPCATPCRRMPTAPKIATRTTRPSRAMRSPTDGDYSLHSWCAHFIEVRVDEDFGTVRVSRVVSALDSGRLYNPKLAESQWKGGIIMGIGQALLEEGIVDPPPWPRHQQQSRRLSDRHQCRHPGYRGDLGRRARFPCLGAWAARRWASSALSAWRRPSPMPSFTRPESASAICRSRWRS